jgi:hypothetical protein
MSSGSKSKQSVRGAKPQVRGAKSRRAPVRSHSNVPVLPIVVGGILVALFVGLLIYGAINNKTSISTPPAVAGSSTRIPCDHLEQTQIHYHAVLQIIADGTVHPLPSGIGIQGGESAPSCFYWLHVHASSRNVIHIESPSQDVFTLGDFFKVWDAFSTYNGGQHQRLSSTQVSTLTVGPNQSMLVYIDLNDGKGPQLATAVDLKYSDPTKIVLKSHETITIEITPPALTPLPTIDWKSSPYKGL